MRGIVIIFALCVLAGCATGPTLEQLEAEALVTGDWSLVEKREAIIAKRRQRQGIDCPSGAVSVCRTFNTESRCYCASETSVYALMGRDL